MENSNVFNIWEFEQQQQTLFHQPFKLKHQEAPQTNTEPSQFRDLYQKWVADVKQPAEQALEVTPANLTKNELCETHYEPTESLSNAYKRAKITIDSVENWGAVVTYKVLVGVFTVKIRMLNINDEVRQGVYEKLINSGAFGKIVMGNGPRGEFVSKRFYFSGTLELAQKTANTDEWIIRANFTNLEAVLLEFAIARVLSMFSIAPKILNPYGFDILCYRNCVEFSMERCLLWSFGYASFNQGEMESRLKYCMKVMHSLRIVHRDIKPGNIVFSPSIGDLVLCDFGISHPIAEEIGFKTKTVQSGTYSFMSPELVSISVITPAYADLYYNDMYCLQTSLKVMEIQRPEPQPLVSLPQNPLCGVLTTLYKLWKKQPVDNQQVDPSIRQFMKYFPEIRNLQPSGVLSDQPSRYLDIEFVASSLPVDNTVHEYLSRCNQEDPKIDVLLRRIFRRSYYEAVDWADEMKHTKQNWKYQEREFALLRSETREFGKKQKARLVRLATNLLYLYVKEAKKMKECQDLLAFLEKYKEPKDMAIYRLMYALAYQKEPCEAVAAIRLTFVSWSMEILDVFAGIAQTREFHELRRSLLHELIELGTSSNHKLTPEYGLQLNELETRISNPNRRNQCLDRYFSTISSKNPRDWRSNDFSCLELVVAEESRSRAQMLIERLLPHVSRYRHPKLLYLLGKCYLATVRINESIKAFEMAIDLMTRTREFGITYIFALQEAAVVYSYIRKYEHCYKLLSKIPLENLSHDVKHYVQSEILMSYARIHSTQGHFDETVRYIEEAKILHKTSAKNFGRTVKAFWIGVMANYIEMINLPGDKSLKRKIARKGLQEIKEYECQKDCYRYFSKHINSFILELKGNCLLALGEFDLAYEYLSQLEETEHSAAKLNQYGYYPLHRLLLMCEKRLGLINKIIVRRQRLRSYQEQSCPHLQQENSFRGEIQMAEISMLVGDAAKLEESLVKIERYLETQENCGDKFELLINLIECCRESHRYDILLRLYLRQQAARPSPKNSCELAVCYYHLRNWEECVKVIQEALKHLPKQNLMLAAHLCRLLSESLAFLGNVQQSRVQSEMQLRHLESLAAAKTSNIDCLYRLAVCLVRIGRTSDARLNLLRAAALSLKKGEVNVSLAVDCSTILGRRRPRTVMLLLELCSERTPQILFELCRSYLIRKKLRMFYSAAAELLRTNRTDTLGLLRQHLTKVGREHERVLLFGVPTIDTANQDLSQHQTIKHIVDSKRLRRSRIMNFSKQAFTQTGKLIRKSEGGTT